ncbi:hypothetical protein LTR85_003930 [Meristemomyces frigidus]|nr:hypothetical protein LTR85_003930 [Meristemomyces frigidus]
MDGAPSPTASSHEGSVDESHRDLQPKRPFAPSDFLLHLPPSTSSALGDEQAPTPNGDGTTAPTSNGRPKPQVDAQGRALNPRSCVTCRKRKVKCDKLHPCTNCNRAHIECVFPAPGRAPRKARKVGEGRDKELLDRLRRLEGVVKGMGVEVPGGIQEKDKEVSKEGDSQSGEQVFASAIDEDAAINAQIEAEPAVVSAAEQKRIAEREFHKKTRWIEEQKQGRFENRFGRLVINEGKSRYINNSFWANLSNEVEDLKGILNQSSDEDEPGSPNSNPTQDSSHQGFVFGFSSQNVDLLSLHPLPNQIPQYWEAYKDRVDPLVKVLHIPTIEATVLSAASHLANLSKGFEALLFAIYYGAVTSLLPHDCLLKFGEEKSVLLSRYRFAVEQALARANFLTTEEAVVLQAFVIFLICLRRNSDARVIWTLTGLVVRIAQTIGIHRDGSHFGLAPFEVEMRRRLWWQVCILDTRASEDHGCDPTIIEQAFDTKMPLNVNDVDISPGMKEFPPERQGCTDISFCLIRFEVANTFRRINYVPPGPMRCTEFFATVTLQDKEKWITECHQRLEERYLKHCDMSVPLFWVTATVSRLMMSKMWLMVYHPFQRQDSGSSLSSETKEKLFITSLENIEYAMLLETEARTMKWGWLFRTYMQWHALAFMLSELCHRTSGDLVERAWVAVEKTRHGRWGEPLLEDSPVAGHLWRPLKKLYRKAKEAHQRGLQENQASPAAQWNIDPPSRRYSPNANPMFGLPQRPQVTRAPLSQAQLQRFTQGPTFGQMPLDKHELLKSPKLSETFIGVEVDPMDTAGLDGGAGQQPLPQFDGRMFSNTAGQPMYAPTATTRSGLGPGPGFGRNFMAETGNIDFGLSPDDSGAIPNPMVPSNMVPASSAPPNGLPPRMDSIDSTFDLDPNVMDTSGELNWENWDQLVRQFGMDVDRTFDIRAGTGAVDGWTGQAPSWDVAPAGQNLMMGMGMGGGDWF